MVYFHHGSGFNVVRSSSSLKCWHAGLGHAVPSSPFDKYNEHRITSDARIQGVQLRHIGSSARIRVDIPFVNRRKWSGGNVWLRLSLDGSNKYWSNGLGYVEFANRRYREVTSDARIQGKQEQSIDSLARIQANRISAIESLARIEAGRFQNISSDASIAAVTTRTIESLARIEAERLQGITSSAHILEMPPESRTLRVLHQNRMVDAGPSLRIWVPEEFVLKVPAQSRTVRIAHQDRTAHVLRGVNTSMKSLALKRFEKDPNSTLNYRVDWSDWIEDGDSIESVEWLVPEALTLEAQTHTTMLAVCLLSGGVLGKTYRVTCRVTTENGLVDDRSIDLAIVST